jgi:hypothetical protein
MRRLQLGIIYLTLLFAIGFNASSGSAQIPSFGGGGGPGVLGGLLGGGTATAQASPSQLSNDLGGLSQKFAASFQAMLTAEAITANALGLKEQSETLEKTAAYYAKGNVDYDQVGTDISTTSATQEQINAKMASATTLDAAAKAKLGTAGPYYATGTVNAAGLPSEYAAWTNRAQASVTGIRSNPISAASNLGLITQVPKVVQLTSQLPSLIQKWSGLTHTFLTFSRKQNVNTGDLASKVGTL